MGRLLSFGISWILLTVLWMLFIGHWSPTEFSLGLISALIGAISTIVVKEQPIASFTGRPDLILQMLRLPKGVVLGSWQLLYALALQIFTKQGAGSLLRAVPFNVGDDDPKSTARRVLAVVYTTATPNSVVLGIDKKNQSMLYHQVLSSPISQMTKDLGARA